MYHHHIQQDGPPQPFSNRPGPFHHQEQAHQQQQQHSHFQYPPNMGSRDMDMVPMDMDIEMGLDCMNGSGSGGYSSTLQPLSESQPGHQQGLDLSNYQHPCQMFSSSPSTVTQQPQSSHSVMGTQAWTHAPVYEPPCPQTRGSHSQGVDRQGIPESAGSILASLGLSSQDLDVLSQYPEDQLTPDKLPYILRDMLSRKSNDHDIAASSSSSYSQSATRAARETLPQCHSLRSVAQTAGKCIDYGHSSLATDVSSSREAFIREPLSSERKMVSCCPPIDMPERWQVRPQPAETNKHRDLDYCRSSGEVHKSKRSPAAEFPLPPRSRRPDLDYRRDGPKRSPSSETRSDYSSSSRRPAPLSSLSKSHDGTKRLPTPPMICDFSAESPKVYPHTCTLCLIDCEQAKDWIEHVKSAKHTDSCRNLHNKYPEWKPNVPRREPHSLRQDDSRTPKEHSPPRSVSARRERTERERERLKREDHGRGKDPRPSSIHSPNRSNRGSSSSSSHRPERRAHHSLAAAGRSSRDSLKRPRDESATRDDGSARSKLPSSAKSPIKTKPKPGSKITKPGSSKADETSAKGPPAKKVSTQSSQSTKAASHLVHSTGIPTTVTEEEVTDLVGGFEKINSVVLLARNEEEEEKQKKPEADDSTAASKGTSIQELSAIGGEDSGNGPKLHKKVPMVLITRLPESDVIKLCQPFGTPTDILATQLVKVELKEDQFQDFPGYTTQGMEEANAETSGAREDQSAVKAEEKRRGGDSGSWGRERKEVERRERGARERRKGYREDSPGSGSKKGSKRNSRRDGSDEAKPETSGPQGEKSVVKAQEKKEDRAKHHQTEEEEWYQQEGKGSEAKRKRLQETEARERQQREVKEKVKRERVARERQEREVKEVKEKVKRDRLSLYLFTWRKVMEGASGSRSEGSNGNSKRDGPGGPLASDEAKKESPGDDKDSHTVPTADKEDSTPHENKESVPGEKKKDFNVDNRTLEGDEKISGKDEYIEEVRDAVGKVIIGFRCKLCDCECINRPFSPQEHLNGKSHKDELLLLGTAEEEDSILKDGKSDYFEIFYSCGTIIGYHCKLCDLRCVGRAAEIREHLNGRKHNVLLIQTKSLRSLYLAKKRDDLEDICRNEGIVAVNKHPSACYHCKLCKRDCTDVYYHLRGKVHIRSLWAKKLRDEGLKKTSRKDEAAGKALCKDQENIKVGEDVKTDKTKVGLAEQPEESKTINTLPEELDKINSGPKETKSSSSVAGDGEASSCKPADLELPKESPADEKDSHTVPTADQEDSIPQDHGNSVYLEEVCFDDGTVFGFHCKVCECSFLTDTKDAHLKGSVHQESEIEPNLNKDVVEVNYPNKMAVDEVGYTTQGMEEANAETSGARGDESEDRRKQGQEREARERLPCPVWREVKEKVNSLSLFTWKRDREGLCVYPEESPANDRDSHTVPTADQEDPIPHKASPPPDAVSMDTTVMVHEESPDDDKDSHTVPTAEEDDSIVKDYGKSDFTEIFYSYGFVIGYHCKLCDHRAVTRSAADIRDHLNGKNHNVLLIQTKSLRSLYLNERDDIEDICRDEGIVAVNKHTSTSFHCKLCKRDYTDTDVYHHLKGRWHITRLWAKKQMDKALKALKKTSRKDEAAGKALCKDQENITVGEDVKTDKTKVGLAEQPEESKTMSSSSAAGDGEASSSKPADLELPKESHGDYKDSHTVPTADQEDSIPQDHGNSVYLEEVCFDDGTVFGFHCKVCKCSFLTDTKDAHLKGSVHKENC